jgi:hypothetical protein
LRPVLVSIDEYVRSGLLDEGDDGEFAGELFHVYESVKLQFECDFFDVSKYGISSLRTSAKATRQIQLSLRLF